MISNNSSNNSSNSIENNSSNNSSNSTENDTLNVLSSNVFNLNVDNEKKIPWRSLDNEKRVEILKDFFKNEFNNENTVKTIHNNTINMLIELINKGKLKLKKEIKYDMRNERIIEISALVKEGHSDNYVYKPEILIKKEKSKKIAKTILFRKK